VISPAREPNLQTVSRGEERRAGGLLLRGRQSAALGVSTKQPRDLEQEVR
jgi:hypothetical protein